MFLLLANIMVLAVSIYLGIGLLFSIPFVFAGAGRIDSTAREATLGFKLIIIPGSMALWPLLAWRWIKGASDPPEEKNAHRVAACRLHTQKAAEGKK